MISRVALHAFMAVVILHLCAGLAAAQKPLAGLAVLRSNSPRTLIMTQLLEEHFVNIINSSNVFTPLNPALLRAELKKYSCTREECLFGFARDAGIKLLIRAEFDDSNDAVVLRLAAYGTDLPYQNKVVYSYTVRMPMTGQYGSIEYSSLMEEHSGFFMANLFARYRRPAYLSSEAGGPLKTDQSITGTFDVFRAEPGQDKTSLSAIKKIGQAQVATGNIVKHDGPVRAGDFVLADYKQLAGSMDQFFYEKKREQVFRKVAFTDTIYKILLTGPGSAIMPVFAPIFGYYWHSDWPGLVVWAFNCAPYLYLEINGLTNYFVNYYKKKKTVPREVQTQYYFGWYMLCAGGTAMFVDSVAQAYLGKAANYMGAQRFLGNPYSAGYLALVGGGAGLFYKGYRHWGYLYYHADNLLLYFTIREFCPTKKYNPLTRSFSRGKINKTRAFSLLSAACAVRLAEFFHAIFTRDNIRNGDISEEGFTFGPVMYSGEQSDLNWGMYFSYRY